MVTTRIRRARFGVYALAALLTLVSACTPPSEPESPTNPYRPPAEVRDATVVWSAAPRIDLSSTEARLVRATSESRIISAAAGFGATYPGFADALDSAQRPRLETTHNRGKIAGTLYQHILEIDTRDTPSGFIAHTCTVDTGISRLVDGKWVPTWIGTALVSYKFTDAAGRMGEYESKTYPLEAGSDRLHWQAPSENVFGSWTARFNNYMELSEFYDVTTEVEPCVAWARTIDPDVALDHPPNDYVRDAPPPVQPVHPGWPDPAP